MLGLEGLQKELARIAVFEKKPMLRLKALQIELARIAVFVKTPMLRLEVLRPELAMETIHWSRQCFVFEVTVRKKVSGCFLMLQMQDLPL